MVKVKETTIEERQIILDLRKDGKSFRFIAKLVHKPLSTIHYIVKKFNEDNIVANRPRTGRPSKLSERDERFIVRKIKKNPFESSSNIASELNESYGQNVTARTVRNKIRKSGFRSRVARKKPFINKRNQKKRIEFAKTYRSMPNSFWNKVIFSDESKFNIFGSDGKKKVWRKPGASLEKKNLKPTLKFGGGSVLVWGCMSAKGVGNLVFIDGIMDKNVYLNIIQNNLAQSAR